MMPSLITAALVLSPKSRPSINPAPMATMFCNTHTQVTPVGLVCHTITVTTTKSILEIGTRTNTWAGWTLLCVIKSAV